MTITAYDRASEILYELRQRLLELPPQGSSEEDACNKRLKELYDELDEICSRAHISRFSYWFEYEVDNFYPKELRLGPTVEDMRAAFSEYKAELEKEIHKNDKSKPTREYILKMFEIVMLSGRTHEDKEAYGAIQWLDANKERLESLILPTQKGEIALNEKVYTVKGICELVEIDDSYFSKIKAAIPKELGESFPKPTWIDGHQEWSRKNTRTILRLIEEYKSLHTKKPPIKRKK